MRSAVYQKAHLPGREPGTKRFEVQFQLGSNFNNLDYRFALVAAAGPPRILLNYRAISGKTRRSRAAYNFTSREILRAADEALYAAKQAGRDLVVTNLGSDLFSR